MIKRYKDFIKESIKLTEEEVGLFNQEPLLQKLISDKKVRLYDDRVEFDETDTQTKEVLDQYLEIPGRTNESVDKKELPKSIDELPLLIRKDLKSLLKNIDKSDYSREDLIEIIKKDSNNIKESLLNEDKKDVADMYVTIEDDDEDIDFLLNIETEDGKKYYTKLKTFRNFDEDDD